MVEEQSRDSKSMQKGSDYPREFELNRMDSFE
jgi:hypothetical protein